MDKWKKKNLTQRKEKTFQKKKPTNYGGKKTNVQRYPIIKKIHQKVSHYSLHLPHDKEIL
jgi:hypothetical protein